MNFLLGLLGALLGIILVIIIIIAIFYWKIKAEVGEPGIRMFKHAIKNASNLEMEEYARIKNVRRGLTRLLEPQILRDFPDFNKNLLFSMCENNLRKILNVIESQDNTLIADDSDFIYVQKKIIEQINDMKSNDTHEKFDNIEFGRHALSGYSKKNGMATIEISSTLSYYYKTNRKDKKSFPDVKKQTRYLSEFVYVYDEAEFDENQHYFSVRCPNCGAPLKSLKNNKCEYCGTHVEKINLRVWKMSSYNEDY